MQARVSDESLVAEEWSVRSNSVDLWQKQGVRRSSVPLQAATSLGNRFVDRAIFQPAPDVNPWPWPLGIVAELEVFEPISGAGRDDAVQVGGTAQFLPIGRFLDEVD